MSYDRYLAICKPLYYTSIMNLYLQVNLVIWSWFVSFLLMFLIIFLIWNLQFCGLQDIDHHLCDFSPLLKLSCSDHTIVDLVYFTSAIFFGVFPFFFILFTYIQILITIFDIPSASGKKKSFSTCSSHLIVVSTYYGTLTTVYMVPSTDQMSNINRMLTLLYNTGTPFFNPIIYSLRNQDIKVSV
ncbi:olfactory receptor 11H4-like [Pelobates fuscus]|uniref:olfactory receptor 11H4-like n=1 Tax=Pelobates fuscus TaxID=191477 RepID=UPI002FE4EEC1